MRSALVLFLFTMAFCTASRASIWDSMTAEEKRTAHRALDQGAEFDFRLQVVDDGGVPVEDVKCTGWASLERDKNKGRSHEGITDSNGFVRVSGKCGEWVSVVLQKECYYRTAFEVKYPEQASAVIDGKWQPYGETRMVVLKKIKKPIQIGEFARCTIPIPVYDDWIGFDFERQMWTPPYGNGRHQDVLLKFGRSLVDRQTDFKMTMDVSFTNNPHAGCYRLNYDKFSDRRNVYQADEGAVYISEMRYVQERHPGSLRNDNRIDWDSYLVFRTRTHVDEDGKLVSAHYGIIGGCWSFYDTMLSGGYLFNPTPNDTNLEDAETARLSRLRYKQSLEFEQKRKVKAK